MTDSCIHEDYSAVPMSAATTEARVNCSDVSIATGVDEHCVASIYFAHNETRILLTDRSSLTNKIYQGSMIQLEDISIIYCNLYSVKERARIASHRTRISDLGAVGSLLAERRILFRLFLDPLTIPIGLASEQE
mmetsp:Transcript_14747/g.41094  ORF Transcript_14747/g.41094 Transcript_14747/m.41094 type:complete len:134 (-) Transcript_14747:2473-2874(-)